MDIELRKRNLNNKDNSIVKSIIFVMVVVIVVSLIGIGSYFILLSNDNNEIKENKKSIDEIKIYNLRLNESDSEEFKSEFNNLKTILSKSEIDSEEYALSVAKLFVIDLYTMDSKINKYDVGGSELVLPSFKENYMLNVTNTLYNYLNDNTDGKRNQNLPHVSKVDVIKSDTKEYTINGDNTPYKAYVYNMKITYKYDLGYDSEVEVIVVNKDNFMYVVEKN